MRLNIDTSGSIFKMNNRIPLNNELRLHKIYLLLLIALAAAFFVPCNGKLFFSGDDDDYFAVATSIAYGQFPSFAKEFHVGEKMPFASVGAGIMASPIVAVFSILDRVQDDPIVAQRTPGNRAGSWSVIGFYVATQLYLILAVLFLYKLTCLWTENKSAFYAVILMMLSGGGLLIYAFNRPVMSHVYELFSLTATLWLLSKIHFGEQKKHVWISLGVALAFVFLTRYNNALITMAGFIVLFFWVKSGKVKLIDAGYAFISFSMLVFIFRIVPIFYNGYSAVDQGYLGAGDRLLALHDIRFYFSRLREIIVGTDMGLIYTAPAFVIAIISYIFHIKKLPFWYSSLAALFTINVFLAVQWCSAGSYYGYRYFVFTGMPLLVVYLAMLIRPIANSISYISGMIFTILFSWMAMSSMLVFGVGGLFSLDRITTICGFPAYSNPLYQTYVMRMLSSDLTEPFVTAFDKSIGGFFKGSYFNTLQNQLFILYAFPSFVLISYMCYILYNTLKVRKIF